MKREGPARRNRTLSSRDRAACRQARPVERKQNTVTIFVDANIRLTEIRRDDTDDLVRYFNESDLFHRWMVSVPYPYTATDAETWFAMKDASEAEVSPKTVNWAIRTVDGALIGGCGFKDLFAEHKAEFGYWLAKSYWNRGIMTKVTGAACEYGFGDLGLARISANVVVGNQASARVLEKCGFVREGVLRRFARRDADFLDVIVYSRLAGQSVST